MALPPPPATVAASATSAAKLPIRPCCPPAGAAVTGAVGRMAVRIGAPNTGVGSIVVCLSVAGAAPAAAAATVHGRGSFKNRTVGALAPASGPHFRPGELDRLGLALRKRSACQCIGVVHSRTHNRDSQKLIS